MSAPISPFRVVLADPPWPYNDTGSRVSPEHPDCGRGYKTMNVRDIASLPVSRLVASDALLFMWTTSTHLLDTTSGRVPPTTRVAKAWGFRPTVVVPWLKVSDDPKPSKAKYADHPALRRLTNAGIKLMPGNGHYTFSTAEFLVIGTRGAAKSLIAERLPNLIAAARDQHSEKPEEQYDYIETLTGGRGPCLELFCRGAGRDPYWVWGLEAEGERRVTLPGVGRWFGDPEAGR